MSKCITKPMKHRKYVTFRQWTFDNERYSFNTRNTDVIFRLDRPLTLKAQHLGILSFTPSSHFVMPC